MWCVAKVGMHDFVPKVDLVREFLNISCENKRFSRNDAAINFLPQQLRHLESERCEQ